MAGYVREHLGRDAVVVHPPIYGAGPWPVHARFDSGLVTMINPCAVKGIGIFIALAGRFPGVRFGWAPGWATTPDDRRRLELLPNAEALPNSRDIDELLARTRVLCAVAVVRGSGCRGQRCPRNPGNLSDSWPGRSEDGNAVRSPAPAVEASRSSTSSMPQPAAALASNPGQALLSTFQPVRVRSGILRPRARAAGSWTDPNAEAPAGPGPAQGGGIRILLAQNSLYYPAHGEATSRTACWSTLAARGHVRVVARISNSDQPGTAYLDDLAWRASSRRRRMASLDFD
jgi:hypothetical protein